MITGTLLGATIGVSLGAPRRKLLFWMAAGIVFWVGCFTVFCWALPDAASALLAKLHLDPHKYIKMF
jgi:hypothetical protein